MFMHLDLRINISKHFIKWMPLFHLLNIFLSEIFSLKYYLLDYLFMNICDYSAIGSLLFG